MPGEFVISPRHPFSSQPISPFRSLASQDKNQPQDMEAHAQSEPRHSYESLDSIAKEKQKAESSSPKSSGMRAALSRAAHKFSPSHSRSASRGKDHAEVLAGSEEKFEKMKKQGVEEQKRKEENEAFGLGKKKGFAPGSMQMHA